MQAIKWKNDPEDVLKRKWLELAYTHSRSPVPSVPLPFEG